MWRVGIYNQFENYDNDKDFSFCTFFFFLTKAFSQFSEEHVIASCTICKPNDVNAADFDKDGDIDIVTASSSDGKIAWFKNDGFGKFR